MHVSEYLKYLQKTMMLTMTAITTNPTTTTTTMIVSVVSKQNIHRKHYTYGSYQNAVVHACFNSLSRSREFTLLCCQFDIMTNDCNFDIRHVVFTRFYNIAISNV